MFTGIIEEIGSVASVRKAGGGVRLGVSAARSSLELAVNDSIAVNGVCLTVVEARGKTFQVLAVEETLKKTNLGALKKGSSVNLELPMKLSERLGGHLVLGHVDTVARIEGVEARETSKVFSIKVPPAFLKYVVPVGSIAVDGVSLTVAELEDDLARFSIIPHTLSHTIFGSRGRGDEVNLEFDILGKYVERLAGGGSLQGGQKLTEQALRESGY